MRSVYITVWVRHLSRGSLKVITKYVQPLVLDKKLDIYIPITLTTACILLSRGDHTDLQGMTVVINTCKQGLIK